MTVQELLDLLNADWINKNTLVEIQVKGEHFSLKSVETFQDVIILWDQR
jgi:hypothetical protein